MKLQFGRVGQLRNGMRESLFIDQEENQGMQMVRSNNCLTSYIRRKLRTTQPQMTINKLALHEIDNLLKDVMEKIGDAANGLLQTSDRSTLSPYCLARACKLALPGRLGQDGRDKGRVALHKYKASYHNQRQFKQHY